MDLDKTWRNRIVGEDMVDPATLIANPLNWRDHPDSQRAAITGSLDDLGWIQRVIVNANTQHVIDGHARVEEALERGSKVPVVYVDLTEAEERIALAIIDPIGAMATTNAERLNTLTDGLTSENDAIQLLIDQMAGENALTFETLPELGESSGRNLGDKKKSVTVVLYVVDLAVFERALSLANNPNRGEAMIAICKAFINEER